MEQKMENYTFYARQCSVSGELMNAGFVILEGDLYIAREFHLIKHLRENAQDILEDHCDDWENLDDQELMSACYEAEYYCYTEWTEDDVDDDARAVQAAAFGLQMSGFNVDSVDINKGMIWGTMWCEELEKTCDCIIDPREYPYYEAIFTKSVELLQQQS